MAIHWIPSSDIRSKERQLKEGRQKFFLSLILSSVRFPIGRIRRSPVQKRKAESSTHTHTCEIQSL